MVVPAWGEISTYLLFFFFVHPFLLNHGSRVLCFQYKVGNLSAWGLPPPSNPQFYYDWSKNLILNVSDSIFFLYPPSEDSVIQVSARAFQTCYLKDPILHMNDGNSLFNITKPGEFFFISGKPGNCKMFQKLRVATFSGNGSDAAYSPASSSSMAPAPSYAMASETNPASSLSSSSQWLGVYVIGLALMLLGGYGM